MCQVPYTLILIVKQTSIKPPYFVHKIVIFSFKRNYSKSPMLFLCQVKTSLTVKGASETYPCGWDLIPKEIQWDLEGRCYQKEVRGRAFPNLCISKTPPRLHGNLFLCKFVFICSGEHWYLNSQELLPIMNWKYIAKLDLQLINVGRQQKVKNCFCFSGRELLLKAIEEFQRRYLRRNIPGQGSNRDGCWKAPQF